MEIVKYPNMNQVCTRCKCEFMFNKEDIKTSGGSGGKHTPRRYLFVNCPICGKDIEVWKDIN